jgi:hypothetical protein
MADQESKRYEALLRGLVSAVHELPSGVLFGANGATGRECDELMQDLLEFERLSAHLGRPNPDFIEGCRWHFEHYLHYLGRQRHFSSYQQYVQDRGGPLQVREGVAR